MAKKNLGDLALGCLSEFTSSHASPSCTVLQTLWWFGTVPGVQPHQFFCPCCSSPCSAPPLHICIWLVLALTESCSEVTSAETFSDSPSRTLSGSLLPLLSFSLWSSLPETVCALFVFLNRIYFFILFTTMLLEPELIAGTGMNEWENELTMDDH